MTRFWIVDVSLGEVGAGEPLETPTDAGRTLSIASHVELEQLASLPQTERLARVRAALDRWAAQHPETELWLHADGAFVAAAAAAAVGLEHEGVRARAATIDWPGDGAERPALVGLDLDWRPPFAAKGRPKFPGGPGTAPSGR
jgi:hypothetical protein